MNSETHPLWDQELYRRAWRYAAEAHHGQIYPGTELPYLVHIGHVTQELTAALTAEPDRYADPDLAVQCALLHDVIEDTSVTQADVESAFGPAVAAGVMALSKRPEAGDTKAARMADSLARIREQPHEVWAVKLADRISNLHGIPHYWSPQKAADYLVEAHQIWEALHPGGDYLARRLRAQMTVYEQTLTDTYGA